MVRKAAALLLGRSSQLQTIRGERSHRAFAQRRLCSARHTRCGLARLAILRGGNCALATASPSYDIGHGWLLSCCRNRYALLRHAHHSDGLGGNNHGNRCTQPRWSFLVLYFIDVPYFRSLRRFPRPRCPCQGSRRNDPLRRRRFLLGPLHGTLARSLPPSSSRCRRCLLPHCTALVHSM